MSVERNGRDDSRPVSNGKSPAIGASEPGEIPGSAQGDGSEHHGSIPGNSASPVVSDTLPVRRPIVSAKQPSQNANLHVGTNVKLKGEVTSCSMLMIDGTVEAEINVGQLLVANGGSFAGTAIADEAEIDGRFAGTLLVSGKLVVRRSGRVTGRLSYGQIEVERGAEIDGRLTMQFGPPTKAVASMASLRKMWPLGR
ncbi:MAG: bactofilin family protein [Rhizomicrobium sp.]